MHSSTRRFLFALILLLIVAVTSLMLSGCPFDPAKAVDGTKVFNRALDFTLNDADEQPRSLSDYRGTVVWLQFMRATECPACLEEADASQAVYQEYHDRGFTIITVLVGSEVNAVLCDTFAAAHGLSFPVLYNNSPDDAWGMYTEWLKVPLNLVIDRDGIIRYKSGKYDGWPDDRLKNVIRYYATRN